MCTYIQRGVFNLVVERPPSPASGPSMADLLTHLRESQAKESTLSMAREETRAREAREFEEKRLTAIADSDAKRQAAEDKRLEIMMAANATREEAEARRGQEYKAMITSSKDRGNGTKIFYSFFRKFIHGPNSFSFVPIQFPTSNFPIIFVHATISGRRFSFL